MSDTTTTRTLGARLTLRTAEPTSRRSTVVRLGTASVLAAIALSGATGTAAAAPLPTFNWSGTSSATEVDFDDLLLTAEDVADIAGRDEDELRESEIVHRFSTDYTVSPSQCLSAYAPGQAASYRGTGIQDVSMSSVAVPRGGEDVFGVIQAVVPFDSKQDALKFMTATANAWADCSGETVTEAGGASWEMGRVSNNSNRTIATLDQTSSSGKSSCERAIAAYRNVFIDTMYCAQEHSVRGQAAEVIKAIVEKAADS